MKKYLLSLAAVMASATVVGQIPLDYYASLDGKTGRELKQAVHETVSSGVNMLSYGSGKNKTWFAFYITDNDNNRVVDRYSDEAFYFGDRGNSVSGMNIEHSFPKSWWGGSENNAYKDLFNLMPCQTTINNHKSNYPMATVDVVWRSNNVTKVGTQKGDPESQNYRYWEPGDQWKGDFARGYLYMATAYQNFTWSGDQSPRILNTEAYPTLKPWASDLYLQWAKNDGVNEIETVRNNRVEKFQGNRNPFVDFPNLAEYIWGDSVGVPFHPLTTVKSQPAVGGGAIISAGEKIDELYNNTLLGDRGGFTVETAAGSAGNVTVWKNSQEYGWRGSGAVGSGTSAVKYNTESTIYSPVLDLGKYDGAWARFDHAVNFATSPYSSLDMLVREVGGDTEPAHVRVWPLGSGWTFYNSDNVDLTPWKGKKIQLGFRYTSNPDEAPMWEIKNLVVKAYKRSSSGVDFIEQDMLDAEDTMAEEYYTIDGRRLMSKEGVRGVIIVKRGSKVTKLYIP